MWERTEALHKLAYYDPITQLPNRLKLLDELQILIDEADSSDLNTATVLFDICASATLPSCWSRT